MNSKKLIAEIGGNHEGDFGVAKELLFSALETDVETVKFQIYTGDSLVNKVLSPDRNLHFKKFELSIDQYKELAELTISKGKDFNASVWSYDLFLEFKNYLSFIKIGSGDLTNYPLIEKFCQHKKPIFISTGLSYFSEVENVVKFIESQNEFYKQPENICVLQCTSMYPINNSDVNLAVLNRYSNFKYSVGYSDHSIGHNALLYAYIMGAKILEFHFTLESLRNTKEFRDHRVSLINDEVNILTKKISEFDLMLGSDIKEPLNIELKNNHEKTFRRAIYFNKNLSAGHIVQKEDLIYLRPFEGISPENFKDILGKRLNKNINMMQPLDFNFFDNG